MMTKAKTISVAMLSVGVVVLAACAGSSEAPKAPGGGGATTKLGRCCQELDDQLHRLDAMQAADVVLTEEQLAEQKKTYAAFGAAKETCQQELAASHDEASALASVNKAAGTVDIASLATDCKAP